MGERPGDLPSRDDILEDLLRIRDAGEAAPDPRAVFVGTEARVALYALVQGNNALARGEMYGGLVYIRLVAETAIRLRWIAFDGEETPDATGRPAVDARVARHRFAALRKRDLLQLAAAHRAIAAIEPAEDRSDLNRQLVELASTIAVDAAPATTQQLATSRTAQKVYAGHRLCSSMLHPGAALGRGTLIERHRAEAMLDEVAYIAATFGDALLRAAAGET